MEHLPGQCLMLHLLCVCVVTSACRSVCFSSAKMELLQNVDNCNGVRVSGTTTSIFMLSNITLNSI